MRVLYVVGSCLSKNTSANMSHNGYIQGLLKRGCQLDILMAKDSWGQNDSLLPMWTDAKYYSYPSTAIHDRIRKFFSSATVKTTQMTPANQNSVPYCGEKSASIKNVIRGYLKNGYHRIFPTDPKYPLEAYWLKKASKFYSDVEYDLVISNSSPAASHKLVDILTHNGNLKYKRWAQIWEDPWYYDLYGGHAKEVFDEERALLDAASEVFYVSPLTLAYQKQYFAENAYKMKQIPLPYFSISKSTPNSQSEMSLAYLGDYYSYVRNLTPFYMALRQTGLKGYIYGDTDISFEPTDHIKISGRVTLSTLAVVQDKAGILVQLCNLHGGQIPGKIYHYSATRKPILFILDGTAEERRQIRSYFSRYNRYYFCENYVDSIVSTIKIIESDIKDGKVWKPVDAFSPETVISQLL